MIVPERRIEQHECVLDVVRNWVKASNNRLVFVENVGRYALYDTDHQVTLTASFNDAVQTQSEQNARILKLRSTRIFILFCPVVSCSSAL